MPTQSEIKIKTLVCNTLVEMLETTSLYKIKVIDLVEQAGISRSSFYVYFDSIYEVIQLIEDNFIAGLPVEEDFSLNVFLFPKDKYATCRYLKENIKTFRVLSGPNGDPAFQARLDNRSKRFSSKLSEFILSTPGTAYNKALPEFISGGTWQLYKWWAYHEDDMSVEDMGQLLDQISKYVVRLYQR